MNATEYQQAQAAIAQQAGERVADLFDVYTRGTRALTVEEFTDLAGVLVAAANTRAAVLADLFQSSRLHQAPVGVGRPLHEADALREAVAALLGDSDDPLSRLRRLATTEPVQASRQAARQVLARHKVTHYRWELSSRTACGLCRFLARRKWPVEKVPVSHPSCTCQVIPDL